MPLLRLEELLPKEVVFILSSLKCISDVSVVFWKDPFSTIMLLKLSNILDYVQYVSQETMNSMKVKLYIRITKKWLFKKPQELYLLVEFPGKKRCYYKMT